MERLVAFLLARLRPGAGWPLALLALFAAAGPGIAAADASLAIPPGPVIGAGLLGAALGLRMARPIGAPWRAVQLLACLLLGLLLLIAVGGALPPLGLVAQDLGGLRGAPELLTVRYLTLSLPRLWGALLAAPASGEAGAGLIVALVAVATTWPAALVLGWATGALRRSYAWGLPLLLALALTTILGGGGGAPMVFGLAMLLALGVAVEAEARERDWEREGYAYSELLRPAALGWGGASVAAAVMLALLIPTELPSLAPSLPAGALPSGLAAIEGQVNRGRPTAAPDPGRSQLPAVALGVSLEQGPPNRLSMRITVEPPLVAAPYPRYWRSRVLNLYTGVAWTSDARRSPFVAQLANERPPGAIVQRVEDLRTGAGLIAAMPDVIALDRPAVAERLPDGSLAALEAPPGAYVALSLPQELASVRTGPPGQPPYTGDTLGLPASVTQRVRDLARTIAGGAATPRAQALALEGYLRGLPYSYEVRPLPRGGDAVDQFLFEMGQGYCTYYASAMAVMARSLGIPARVAIGYATGVYDPATGVYLVRERDAHAWPELFIEGRWLPFEPTPALPLPDRGLAAPQPTALPTDAPAAIASPVPWGAWAALGLAVVAVAAAGGWLAWRRLRRPALARAQLLLERLGRAAGVPWPTGATLREYGRLLAARSGGDQAALDELIGLIEGASYGGRPLGPEQEQRLRGAASALRASLRRRPDSVMKR